MTKEQLIERLRELRWKDDWEVAHLEADRALLEYINDETVTDAFERVGKWYA